MGAVPSDQGVTFRVWAPNASRVSVAGTFNDWSDAAGPLFSEGNGYWSADVAGAGVGDQYKFFIVSDDLGWQGARARPLHILLSHMSASGRDQCLRRGLPAQ